MPGEAAAVIAERHLDVVPQRVGARVAFVHSLTIGLGVVEHEPEGKAAAEIRKLLAMGLGADHPVNAKNGATMLDQDEESPWPDQFCRAQSRSHSDGAPGRENDSLSDKRSPENGTRVQSDNSWIRSTSAVSLAIPCTGRPGAVHGPRSTAGSLERPVPETQSPIRLLDAGCTLKPVACQEKAHGRLKHAGSTPGELVPHR